MGINLLIVPPHPSGLYDLLVHNLLSLKNMDLPLWGACDSLIIKIMKNRVNGVVGGGVRRNDFFMSAPALVYE